MAEGMVVTAGLQSALNPSSITAWRTADEIKEMRKLVVQVMREVMKENTHYGTIPGCDKPSLWKPGAEILFSTFRISADPVVTNLSTDEEIRYQVMVFATSASGQALGSSVGECSSSEDKYKWRRAVCSEEWEGLPDTKRRLKWKRGQKGFYQVQQVRAEIADCANTVLRMAHKRAFVALALQVTAASDVFTQGLEDLPEEIREDMVDEYADAGEQPPAPLPAEIKKKAPVAAAPVRPPDGPAQPLPPRPQQAVPNTPRQPIQQPRTPQVRVISEPQARRFYAIRKQNGRSDEEVREFLQSAFGITDDRQIPAAEYERACKWAETGDDF